MFCTYCGARLPPTSVFCHVCGARVVAPPEGSPEPPEADETPAAPPEEMAAAPEAGAPEPDTADTSAEQYVPTADLDAALPVHSPDEQVAPAPDAVPPEPDTGYRPTEQSMRAVDLGPPPLAMRPPTFEAPPFRAPAPPPWAASPLRPAQDVAGVVVGVFAIAGALLVALGAFLPWVDSGLITVNGVEFGPITWNGFDIGYLTDPANGSGGVDGLIFLIVGLGTAGIAVHYFFMRHSWVSFAVVVLGVGMYALGLYNLVCIVHDARTELDMSTREALDVIGAGLYLCIVGGIVASLAAVAGTWKAMRR